MQKNRNRFNQVQTIQTAGFGSRLCVGLQKNFRPTRHAFSAVNGGCYSLCVVDGPKQREDGDVAEGNLHGHQVGHIVFVGPLGLHARRRTTQGETKSKLLVEDKGTLRGM